MADSIQGQITNPAGAAVAGAQVAATDGQNQVFGPVATDANGNYTIANLAAGVYTVSVKAPQGLLDPQPLNNVNVAQGQDTVGQNSQLAIVSIAGSVKNRAGQGIQGRQVTANQERNQGAVQAGQVQTDANGNYAF